MTDRVSRSPRRRPARLVEAVGEIRFKDLSTGHPVYAAHTAVMGRKFAVLGE